MAQYFFHVRGEAVLYEDRRGGEFADLQAAWNWAAGDVRHIIEDGALNGSTDQYWIEICDMTGADVATVPFARILSRH